MDVIRRKHDEEEEFEFYWFAREYPRFFRSQVNHAQYRLKNIYTLYESQVSAFKRNHANIKIDNFIGYGIGGREVEMIYWEFEALLGSINTSLELIARILTPAFKQHTPITFNKLCKKKELGGPIDILRKAKIRWIDRMKEYRDCFVHFSGVDTLQMVGFNHYSDGIEMRAKIPSNPQIREHLGFNFRRKDDVLRYSIWIYRCLRALDKKIGNALINMEQKGEFPVRLHNLHYIAPKN